MQWFKIRKFSSSASTYHKSPILFGKYLGCLKSYRISSVFKICVRISVFRRKKCRKAEYVQRRVRFVNVQVPCPLSIIYVKFCTSRLCMKMSSFLFVCVWTMPRILYLSCGIPFPVKSPGIISGLTSVVLWLSRWEVIKKISGNFLRGGGGQKNFEGRGNFWGRLHF